MGRTTRPPVRGVLLCVWQGLPTQQGALYGLREGHKERLSGTEPDTVPLGEESSIDVPWNRIGLYRRRGWYTGALTLIDTAVREHPGSSVFLFALKRQIAAESRASRKGGGARKKR